MQSESRQQFSIKQGEKKARLKFRDKGCHSLPLRFPSIKHVLPTNRPIPCLESVVDWILDKIPEISGWKTIQTC